MEIEIENHLIHIKLFPFADSVNLKQNGLSSNGFHYGQSVLTENPPFLPGFFVLKMLINETAIIPSVRTPNIKLIKNNHFLNL